MMNPGMGRSLSPEDIKKLFENDTPRFTMPKLTTKAPRVIPFKKNFRSVPKEKKHHIQKRI